MRKLAWIILIFAAATGIAGAQTKDPTSVTASVKEIYSRHSKFIAAGAAEMPADKYGYHPTPDQWMFRKIVAHVAQANLAVCSMISDTPARGISKPNEAALPSLTELVADLNDHYSQLASYLRLNGMVPPSVKPQT